MNFCNTFAGLCQKATLAFWLNSTVSFVDMFALSVGTKVGSWVKFLQNLCSEECQAAHQSSRWNGVRQLRVQTVISELQNFALCSTAYLHKKYRSQKTECHTIQNKLKSASSSSIYSFLCVWNDTYCLLICFFWGYIYIELKDADFSFCRVWHSCFLTPVNFLCK